MRTLKEIDSDISQQRNEVKTKLSVLLKERQEYFDGIFNDSKKLEKICINAENSSSFELDSMGEVMSWYRPTNGLAEFEECQDELENWLNDKGFDVDFKNDLILMRQGESIIINDEGDIFLGHKVIIKHENYRDTNDRNAQIESYMEKNGYFPGVFKVDNYGNVTLINTQKKE